MRTALFAIGLAAISSSVPAEPATATANTACPPLLDISIRRLAGEEQVNLCQAYRGKVILVVNTASKCGFTSQYEDLEALYRKYQDRGLIVLGFPSNDFMQ
ncbi:MAG: glutathione peroxidase, partial [Chromatiaceae bacterium]